METKLPQEFKEKWIAALRSGEYKQAKGTLYDPHTDSFCCIGVAGHLCGVDKERLIDFKMIGIIDHPDVMPAPKQYPDAISITKQFEEDVARKLSSKNDKGYSFSEIADWIEEHL
jgi:hypothetical protein